eukprot:gene18939-20844_t
MGCDSSILRKKEEPDRQDYIEHTKVISPDPRSKKQSRRQQKQSSVRGKAPKYRTKIDSRVLAKYDVKALIGKGSFSDVLRVENKVTKQPYAVKILRLKNHHSKEVSQSELAALTRIRFPYVINLIEVFESKECVYLVMELATGGELYERIKMKGHLSEKESIRALQMVLDGVVYLHSKGITHRDLKPENLLFYHPGHDSKILITDFGFAKTTSSSDENTLFTTWCGTPEYVAPELLCKKPYTNSVDMWAIGVITFVMISGHLPFAAESPPKLYQQIVRAKYSYSREIWKSTSDGAKSFIDSLLQVEPEKRLKAVDARKHSWINSVAPLVNYKGHSSKYLSSQAGGKSVKSSVTLKSPVLRHKRFEAEAASYDNSEKRSRKKSCDTNSVNETAETDERANIDNRVVNEEVSKNLLTQETFLNEFENPVPMKPVSKIAKLDSAPTSSQDEIPSAAATEDTNSLASRMERNESDNGSWDKTRQAKHAGSDLSHQAANFALNRFVNETNLRSDWPTRHNLAFEGDGEASKAINENGNILKNRRRKGEELDILLSPLQRSNLRWHMQENTSVDEKVGMWLEGQSGYYKDDRLSASSGAVDQLHRSELRARSDAFDRVDLHNGLSCSSSPIKHSSYGLSANILPNLHVQNNLAVATLSPRASLANASEADANLVEEGSVLNEHLPFRAINGLVNNDLKDDQSFSNGLELRQLKGKNYNDTLFAGYNF